MTGQTLVRIAEIEIDPDRIEDFRACLAEGMRLAVEREPGVLALHALSLADRPHVFRIVEVYRSRADYEAHLTAPHFLTYKARTAGMVRSLVLHDAGWASLASKSESGSAA